MSFLLEINILTLTLTLLEFNAAKIFPLKAVHFNLQQMIKTKIISTYLTFECGRPNLLLMACLPSASMVRRRGR
jgi:hypothetical protein